MRETIYLMQSSFATGEVSPEVASRIDMEKYQAALLQAENCYIRPYGAVYKGPDRSIAAWPRRIKFV